MITVLYTFLGTLGTLIFTIFLLYVISLYYVKNIRKSATLDIKQILDEINKGILLLIWNTRPREKMLFHSIWGMQEPSLPRKILFSGENCKHLLPFVLKSLPSNYFENNNKRILYIDLDKCKVDENFNFLFKILRKLGFFKPFEEFINSIAKALKMPNNSYENKPNSEILDLIVNETNNEKIIVVFNNCQFKTNKNISSFMSDIISRVNDVAILTEPRINSEILNDNHTCIRKIQFVPNIYFDSAIFFANQHEVFEFNNRIYNGRDDSIFRAQNSLMYLYSRLDIASLPFYKNLFKFFGGNEYYVERTEGIEYLVNQHKDLLYDDKMLLKYYRKFFKNRMEKLNAETFNLLLFVGIAPFSVHYSDIKAFCDSFNVDFEDGTKILEDYLLLFKTNPSYYINLDIEFTYFEKKHPEKMILDYFANGTDSDGFPYYVNCADAKPLVRALINEALIQRFHKDWGYYITNPLRRIIRYLCSNDDNYKKVVLWAYQYYSDLRKKHDSPSVELAFTFFCNESNKIFKKENYSEMNFERLKLLLSQETTSSKESFCYYSILSNEKMPILLTDRRFRNNLGFCYSHIINIPTVLLMSRIDEEDIENNNGLNEKNNE